MSADGPRHQPQRRRRAERSRPGVETHRHRLRLLDFPAQRFRDVLRAVRRLRRAGPRRPTAAPARTNCSTSRASPSRPRRCSLSSFACGMASIAACAQTGAGVPSRHAGHGGARRGVSRLRVHEFCDLVAAGDGPQRSAFLSAFFTLVGCHGLHVSLGLLWLLTMMAQVFAKGFRADILRRLLVLLAVLARARHHLGRHLHRRLPLRSLSVSDADEAVSGRHRARRRSARRRHELGGGVVGYIVGLGAGDAADRRRLPAAGAQPRLAAEHPDRARGAGDRADGRASRVLPARHDRTGQRQQRAGARLRRADRVPGDRRLDLDHACDERQHDGPRHGRCRRLQPAISSATLRRRLQPRAAQHDDGRLAPAIAPAPRAGSSAAAAVAEVGSTNRPCAHSRRSAATISSSLTATAAPPLSRSAAIISLEAQRRLDRRPFGDGRRDLASDRRIDAGREARRDRRAIQRLRGEQARKSRDLARRAAIRRSRNAGRAAGCRRRRER